MKDIKDRIKEKVKGKAKTLKEKLKGAKKCAALVLCAAASAALVGCMDTNPASRQNSNTFGDIEPAVKVVIGEYAASNTVAVTVSTTLGDGVLASADSSGSTETQKATPSMSIPVRVDARYNDALAAASTTSRGILESLTQTGMEKVLALMQSGGSGTVTVEKKDGTTATVTCADGQCTTCVDGTCAPADAK